MSLNSTLKKKDTSETKKQAYKPEFLQGQVTAAVAIMRAAQAEIAAKKLPEVQKYPTSVQSWQQFWNYYRIWRRNVFVRKQQEEEGNVIRSSDPTVYEDMGPYLFHSFGHWLWMVIQEIAVYIALGFNFVFVKIRNLIGNIAFQISRFFRWNKNRRYWKSLKRDMIVRDYQNKFNAWKEDLRVKRKERAVNREVAAMERQTRKQEEAERKAAVRKEEEAIRQARLQEAAAKKHTQEIEAELAAISLRRKAEEERVNQEIIRKEEAEKLLHQAQETEEKERAVFAAKRAEQEEARLAAIKQEEEARARLEVLRKEEEERKRLDAVREAEIKRLKAEEERLAAEKLQAEEKRKAEEEARRKLASLRAAEAQRKLEEERAQEEKKKEELRLAAEAAKAQAEQLRKAIPAKLADAVKSEPALPKEEAAVTSEPVKKDEPVQPVKTEEKPEAVKPAEVSKLTQTVKPEAVKPAEVVKPTETVKPEAEKTKVLPETPKVSETTETKVTVAEKPEKQKAAEPLQKNKETAQPKPVKAKAKKKPVPVTKPQPAYAAGTARAAVKSMPVSTPAHHLSIPDSNQRERMITEARDKTSNFIRKAIIRSEIESVYGNPKEAIKLTVIKYAVIALVACMAAYIGVSHNPENAVGAGSFILVFFLITVVGSLLELGGGYLAGVLLNRSMTVSKTAVMEKNSVYTILFGLCFSLCAILLAVNKSKFTSVFAALVILAMIGHFWVLYRVSKNNRGYSCLVYLLVVCAVGAVVLLTSIIFRSPLNGIWNTLL